jgi:hypothetical protein
MRTIGPMWTARRQGRARVVLLLAWPLAAALAGCPAPPSALARAQQAAREFNQDARFGRDELMMERVAPAARDDFAKHHRGWGTSVRVADLELAGMRPHGDHDLDVVVRVAWYRPEQLELRVTTLQQSWRDTSGWQLVDEKRVDGDVGLLGESVVYERPNEARLPAQFPTVHLGGGATGPDDRTSP